MGAEYNYVEYNYGGIVGGSHNTVNNFLYADHTFESFFSGGTDRGKGNEYKLIEAAYFIFYGRLFSV